MPYKQTRLQHALDRLWEGRKTLIGYGQHCESLPSYLKNGSKYELRRRIAPASRIIGPVFRTKSSDSDDEYDPGEERRAIKRWSRRKTGILKRPTLEVVEDEQERAVKRSRTLLAAALSITNTIDDQITLDDAPDDKNLVKGPDIAEEYRTQFWDTPDTMTFEAKLNIPRELQLIDRGLWEKEGEKNPDYVKLEETGLRNGKRVKKAVERRGRREQEDDAVNDILDATFSDSIDLRKRADSGVHMDESGERQEHIPTTYPKPTKLYSCLQDVAISAAGDLLIPPVTAREEQSVIERPISSNRLPRQAGVLQITTSFAHPMSFKHDPKPDLPCHFCWNYRTGILGLGKKRVDVVQPSKSNPTDLEELGNGWRAEGHEPTRMCFKCGLDRVMIITCHKASSLEDKFLKHTFKPLAECANTVIKQQSYMQALFRSLTSKGLLTAPEPRSPFFACSLCPLPASWQCCRWQKQNRGRQACHVPGVTMPEENQKICQVFSPRADLAAPKKGCGLKLCSRCHDFLTEDCKGILDKKKVGRMLKTSKLGPRADVEFLFEGSMVDLAYKRSGERSKPMF